MTFEEVLVMFDQAKIDYRQLYWNGAQHVKFDLQDETGRKLKVVGVEVFDDGEGDYPNRITVRVAP